MDLYKKYKAKKTAKKKEAVARESARLRGENEEKERVRPEREKKIEKENKDKEEREEREWKEKRKAQILETLNDISNSMASRHGDSYKDAMRQHDRLSEEYRKLFGGRRMRSTRRRSMHRTHRRTRRKGTPGGTRNRHHRKRR